MKNLKKLVALSMALAVLMAQSTVFAAAPVQNVVEGQPYTFVTYYDDYNDGSLYEYPASVVFNSGVKTNTVAPAGYAWQSTGLITNYGEIGYYYGWYGFNWIAADNSPNEEHWIEVSYVEDDYGNYVSKSTFGVWFNGKYYDSCEYVVTRSIVVDENEAGLYCMDVFNYELLLPVGYTDATFTFIPMVFDPNYGGFVDNPVNNLVIAFK